MPFEAFALCIEKSALERSVFLMRSPRVYLRMRFSVKEEVLFEM